MSEVFFKPTENFNKIIEKYFKQEEIKSIKQITTGWTNIVMEVVTIDNTYFFRFPRDDFWSKMIIKDCKFGSFIYGKTSFQTPQIKLCYDEGRPFSIHKKIEGICLNECIENLSNEAMTNIANDISKFICELGNIDIKELPEECNITLLDFLDELANTHFDDINLWQYEYFESMHIDNCLVHGDLNPGNIILDKDYNVIGIIDFCFAGIGNPYADTSRIIGRSPTDFSKIMIEKYEEHSKEKVNNDTLERFIQVWNDIDKGYISYIRNNNPDIKLPVMF